MHTNRQLMAAGRQILKSEDNIPIVEKALEYLLYCGIDPKAIPETDWDISEYPEVQMDKADRKKKQLRKFLESSTHKRYIFHAAITYLLMSGLKDSTLCPACGFSRATVFGWQKNVREGGWKTLKRKSSPGCPKKLPNKLLNEIREDIFLFDDKPRVNKIAVYIYKKYGIKMTERYCQQLYHKLNKERPYPYGQQNLFYMIGFSYDDEKEWMANYDAIYKEMFRTQ